MVRQVEGDRQSLAIIGDGLEHLANGAAVLSAWELLALAGTGIAKALFEAKPKNVAHLAPAVSADTLVALLGRLQR